MVDPLLISFSLVSIVIFLGFFGEIIFEKTNVPDILVLFLFGILIGPVLKFVNPSQIRGFSTYFVTFTLIFILFENALNINIKDFLRGLTGGSKLGFINFILSTTITSIVLIIFGYAWELSVLVGMILGGISSSVVIPLLERIHINKNSSVILTIESAFSDVLCIVGSLTFIEIIRLKTFAIGQLLNHLLSFFVLSAVIGAFLGFIWLYLNKYFLQFAKSYMTTVAFLVFTYTVVEFVGANGAIGALAFGLVLGNSRKVLTVVGKENIDKDFVVYKDEKFFYSQVKFFVKSFFFVYLGVIMSFSNPSLFLIALVVALGVTLMRPIAVWLVARNGKAINQKDQTVMEAMVSRGIAAAVLVEVALRKDVVTSFPRSGELSTIILAVILFTLLVNSIYVFAIERYSFSGLTSRFFYEKNKGGEKATQKN